MGGGGSILFLYNFKFQYINFPIRCDILFCLSLAVAVHDVASSFQVSAYDPNHVIVNYWRVSFVGSGLKNLLFQLRPRPGVWRPPRVSAWPGDSIIADSRQTGIKGHRLLPYGRIPFRRAGFQPSDCVGNPARIAFSRRSKKIYSIIIASTELCVIDLSFAVAVHYWDVGAGHYGQIGRAGLAWSFAPPPNNPLRVDDVLFFCRMDCVQFLLFLRGERER